MSEKLREMVKQWREEYPLSVDMDHTYAIAANEAWNCANRLEQTLDELAVLEGDRSQPPAKVAKPGAPTPNASEDVWIDELEQCTTRDQRRTFLRAFAANVKMQFQADSKSPVERAAAQGTQAVTKAKRHRDIWERLEHLNSLLRDCQKEPPMGWQAHIVERIESVLRNYPRPPAPLALDELRELSAKWRERAAVPLPSGKGVRTDRYTSRLRRCADELDAALSKLTAAQAGER